MTDLRLRGTRWGGARASLSFKRVPDGGLEVTAAGETTRIEPESVVELRRWLRANFPARRAR